MLFNGLKKIMFSHIVNSNRFDFAIMDMIIEMENR